MNRLTISIEDGAYDKISEYAKKNKMSLSAVISKMVEIGLLVTEKQTENSSNNESIFSEIEKHCFKASIQSNILMRKIAEKNLNFSSEDFDNLTKITMEKYQMLMGFKKEESFIE